MAQVSTIGRLRTRIVESAVAYVLPLTKTFIFYGYKYDVHVVWVYAGDTVDDLRLVNSVVARKLQEHVDKDPRYCFHLHVLRDEVCVAALDVTKEMGITDWSAIESMVRDYALV